MVALFWTVILGFATGTEKTFASLRSTYELQTGTLIASSSFWARFNDAMALLTILMSPKGQRQVWGQRMWALWCHDAAEAFGGPLSLLEQVDQGLNYGYIL